MTYKHFSPRCSVTVCGWEGQCVQHRVKPTFTNKIWYLCCTRNLEYCWGDKNLWDTQRHPHDTLVYCVVETVSAKEAVLPWTSCEKCFRSPLSHHIERNIINERAWGSLRSCFDHENMSLFLDQTTVFFQVIIDQALLSPSITNGHLAEEDLHEVWFPRLPMQGTMWSEHQPFELFSSKTICSMKECAAGLWSLTYITSNSKERYISAPTEFSCFRGSLDFFWSSFLVELKSIFNIQVVVSPGTLWTSCYESQGHRVTRTQGITLPWMTSLPL